MSKDKLWTKNVQMTDEIEHFTVGKDREMDLYLAKYDVLGSMAHITMLESIGLLTKDELQVLLAVLRTIYQEAESGRFVIEEGVEDVHSQVELMLTRQLGDIGKKIHSGRSRNDQVLVDLKLFIRDQLREIAELTEALFHELIDKSNTYKDVLMPGYTHLQVAMPSSFGLWFGAYAESLADDMQYLLAAWRITNRNPLGSAAGYGSSFPLNRQMTTDLLGFDSMDYNVVYAQMGRGKTERNVAFSMASINNLPSGYFRDLQIIKEVFLPSFDELKDCLRMAAYIINRMKVNEHILDNAIYDNMFSVEEVNRLASKGMPFRDAYKKVGLDIESGNFTPQKQIHHTHEGSIGNLCNDKIEALMQKTIDEFGFFKVEEAITALVSD